MCLPVFQRSGLEYLIKRNLFRSCLVAHIGLICRSVSSGAGTKKLQEVMSWSWGRTPFYWSISLFYTWNTFPTTFFSNPPHLHLLCAQRLALGVFSKLQRQQDLRSLKYCTHPRCQRPVVAFIPFLPRATRLPGESLLGSDVISPSERTFAVCTQGIVGGLLTSLFRSRPQ